MRNIKIKLAILFLVIFLAKCTKNDYKNSNEGALTYLKIEKGGCNEKTGDNLKNESNENPDTVFFSHSNSILNVHVGLNYKCCTSFTENTVISGDSVLITIKDTNPDNSLDYCRCMCYYTWDFKFYNLLLSQYYFNIILKDPNFEQPVTLFEGIVVFSEL